MRKILQKHWYFQEKVIEDPASFHAHEEQYQVDEDAWQEITIPHDSMIVHPEKFYQSSISWYRYPFTLSAEDLKKKHFFYFEGIYMESVVYCNGHALGQNRNGYLSFSVDCTNALLIGENEILVKVLNLQPNSRWYSGCGIYRDVWHIEKNQSYIVDDGLAMKEVHENNHSILNFEIEMSLEDTSLDYHLLLSLWDKEEKHIFNKTLYLSEEEDSIQSLPKDENFYRLRFQLECEDLQKWSTNDPNLYLLRVELFCEDSSLDQIERKVGFRSIAFDSEKGFLLNGEHLPIQGVCLHHDLGGFGSRYVSQAARRNLVKMKEMGVNAIRTAHNAFSSDFLSLCDELGLLVVDEILDIWELSKTKFDYARFFREDFEKDLALWVRRDLMHPSVILWSVGNEVYDTHKSEKGLSILEDMIQAVRAEDRMETRGITIGSNYMAWENTRKCADLIKIIGYNYSEKLYAQDHEKHKDWIIYGSETGSLVMSRGVYHFPYEQSVLADDDSQCSSLGNSATSWGAKNTEFLLEEAKRHPFSLGQFLWTGIDYIGEPTPYHSKNSYFGLLDTAALAKDAYFQFQAAWRNPEELLVLHLLPHWDWNPGQRIDCRAFSNAFAVELFLNGKSEGIRYLNWEEGKVDANWQLLFEPGTVKVQAYNERMEFLKEVRVSTPSDVKEIRITEDTHWQNPNKRDGHYFFLLEALDAENRPVQNANHLYQLDVEGPANLLFLNNGDSTDFLPYMQNQGKLFSGKALAVLEAYDSSPIRLSVRAKGLATTQYQFTAEHWNETPSSSVAKVCGSDIEEIEQTIRKITLRTEAGTVIRPERATFEITASIHGVEELTQELFWRVTEQNGVDSLIASFEEVSKDKIRLTVKGDGTFYVRCGLCNGKGHLDFYSMLSFTAEGFGQKALDPFQFLSASLYSQSQGLIGNGNERGVSMARDHQSWVVYENLDFTKASSQGVEMPIFSLSDTNHYRLWKGVPYGENSVLLADRTITRKSIWNTYQLEYFDLAERMQGIETFAIEMQAKAHIKGFRFLSARDDFALKTAKDLLTIYGDSYQLEENRIYHIGNNVSLLFGDFDFSEKLPSAVRLKGRANGRKNSIHLVLESENTREVELLEIAASEEMQEIEYPLAIKKGHYQVTLLFLPGSDFDFYSLQFLEDVAEGGEE